MTALRRLVRAHVAPAAWLLTAALFLKLLVPAGYMLSVEGNAISVVPCRGVAPTISADMPGMAAHHGGGKTHDDRGEGARELPCAFAGLGLAGLAAVDPVLLAAAILFAAAVALRPVARAARHAVPRPKPPSHAPPIPASTS